MSGFPIEKMKVLVVEDNQHFRLLIRAILKALGVQDIEEASDGAEALEMLNGYAADLAILDWNMTGVDGIECVRRIRQGQRGVNRFLPIIMLTGHTEESLMHKALNTGANDFLSKPVSAKSLSSRIVAVMQGTQVYVETSSYFGPDRRRSLDDQYQGGNRRKAQTNLMTYEPFQDNR